VIHGRQGDKGQSPPEAKALFVFERSMKATNLPNFLQFETAKNRIFMLYLQKNMGDHETGG